MDKKSKSEWSETNHWHDPSYYEHFFRQHYLPFVLFARRFIHDTETARDIVQDVFLKTWENRSKIELKTSLSSYLLTAIRNQCANHFKHKAVQQQYNSQAEMALKELELQYYANVEEQNLMLYEQDALEQLQETLKDLPDKCREIFELSRFKGLKSAEIANLLSISVRTVETQIYRALKKIKKSITER